MKFSVQSENLARALSLCSRALAPHASLPVLANYLIEAQPARLKIAASNLEISATAYVTAEVAEPGAITLPARTLADWLSTLAAGPISATLNPRTATVRLTAGRATAQIKGVSADEYPQLPAAPASPDLTLDPERFKTAAGRLVMAAATEDTRPVLRGVQFALEGRTLTLAAADGLRLSVCTLPVEATVEAFQALVPAAALAAVAHAVPGTREPLTVSRVNQAVVFQLGAFELAAQLLDGAFPRYGAIIARTHRTRAVVATPALLKACRLATVFAREAQHVVRLKFQPGDTVDLGCIELAADSAETGSNTGLVDAAIDGDESEVAFNARYLHEALSVIGAPQAALEIGAERPQGRFTPIGDDTFFHVLMAVNLDPR